MTPASGGGPMTPSRRPLGALALGLGIVVAVAAQRLAPIAGPPLYDGVIVEAPYLWLSPPAGHSGGARGITQTIQVQGSQSPDVGVGTSENPPQIGIFAGAGDLKLPPDTSSIRVSIEPVPAPAQPSAGVIAGNVYRVSLTNQNGLAVTAQASGGATIELRGPIDSSNATVERFAGSLWVPLASDSVGVPNMYTAVVTDFGDFAIVAQPGWTPAPDGGGGGGGSGASDARPVVVGGVIAAALVAIGLLGSSLYTRRRRQSSSRPSAYPTRLSDAGRAAAVRHDKPLERKGRGR
jgi:hypothetical protein